MTNRRLKEDLLDSELLSAVAEGDETAFAILYRRYHNRLHNFLIRFTYDDPSKAGDILQEAFLRVWLNRDQLPNIDNFQSWIFKIVSNESLTFLRKETHIKNKTSRLKDSYETGNTESVLIPRLMEFDEIKHIIKETVDSMPEQRRKIYMLSREQGLNAAEIAKELGLSQNTVYNTLSSALKHIRKSLSARGYLVSVTILILLKII